MWGLPDSWAGWGAEKVITYKPNSRKIPAFDSYGMAGWAEIYFYYKAQREAKRNPQKIEEPEEQPASATFSPREEKEKKVRFIVIDDE